jgi:Phage tail tube protein
MSYGMDLGLGISFQNSYGTLNTGSMHWLQPTAETVTLKKAENVRKGLRGIYDDGASIEGANSVGGDITIEADGVSLGVLLEAVLGRTTVTSGSLYTHTYKPRTADQQSLASERPFTLHKHLGDSGSAHLYSDLCGDTLDLVIANGALMTAKLGVMGGTYSQIAKLSPTYYTGAPFDWSVSSVSLGGSTRINFESLTFSLKNNLAAKNTLGDGSAVDKYPDRIKRNGMRTVDVSGTVLFDDQTDLQTFLAQTYQRFVVSFAGALNITSGYNESLTIDMPNFKITDFPQGVPNAGELSVSFKGSAEYSTTSATALAITLVNSKAGY